MRAVAAAVEQVIRYREQVDLTPSLAPARAIVAAPDFAPQARVLADARGVECVCSIRRCCGAHRSPT